MLTGSLKTQKETALCVTSNQAEELLAVRNDGC